MSEAFKTPFYDCHLAASAKMVDFAGWSLPIHYGSLVDEHHAVRSDAGMFDVSHMVVSDVRGQPSINALRLLVTNDINKLTDNTALYGCLCHPDGGVVDDLIVYRITADHFRVISNAATRSKVLSWLWTNGVENVQSVASGDLAMLAVQGPNAVAKVQGVSSALFGTDVNIAELPPFGCSLLDAGFVGRTGYTGEDGVEVVIPKASANTAWRALLDADIKPCGLGARDTLRLEAGMSLYGNDLDDEHSPIDCGVGWTVDTSDARRAFMGREVLEEQLRNGSPKLRIGIELQERGVLRAGQTLHIGDRHVGVVTSGTFSPTLQRTIALARVGRACAPAIADQDCGLTVEIRNKPIKAFRVAVPFLKNA